MSRTPDEVKRDKIIETAMAFFGSKGYRNTTIKDIAQEVGIAPGTIYTYYSDKNDLFEEAIRTNWQLFFTRIEESVKDQGSSYEEAFMGLLKYGLNVLSRSRALVVNIFQTSARKKLLKEHIEKASGILVPFFEKGARAGLFEKNIDPRHRAFQIRNMLSGIFLQLALVDDEGYAHALGELEAGAQKEFFPHAK